MLPTCSVCGLPTAEYNTATDELGNPAGEWIHVLCRARDPGSTDIDNCGSLRGSRIPKQKKALMHYMRIPSSRVGTPVRQALYRMQVGLGKVRTSTRSYKF